MGDGTAGSAGKGESGVESDTAELGLGDSGLGDGGIDLGRAGRLCRAGHFLGLKERTEKWTR